MSESKSLLKNAALILVTAFLFTLWVLKGGPDINKIAYYISHNINAALLCCLALIIFKCFATIIPTTAIYFVCGYILPPWYAVTVCVLCNALVFTISYFSGKRKAEGKLSAVSIPFTFNNGFLYALFLHCIRIVPLNTAGSFLGESGASFWASFLGAVLGMIPSITVTLSLTENLPNTPPPLNALLIIGLITVHIVYLSFSKSDLFKQ